MRPGLIKVHCLALLDASATGPASVLAAQGNRVILPDLRGHGDRLTDVSSEADGGTNRRVLTALANGDSIDPGSPDTEAALRQIQTRTLIVAGDQDHAHASAGALAAVLPNTRFTRVPGDHWSALTSPELATAITAFLAGRPR
jgi:pimeloyl-ACP methyl ester carboxylesterase